MTNTHWQISIKFLWWFFYTYYLKSRTCKKIEENLKMCMLKL